MSVQLWQTRVIEGTRYKLRESEPGVLEVDGVDLEAERAAALLTGELSQELHVLLVMREEVKERGLEAVLAELKEKGPVSSASGAKIESSGSSTYLAICASEAAKEFRDQLTTHSLLHPITMLRLLEDESSGHDKQIAAHPSLTPEVALRVFKRGEAIKELVHNPRCPLELVIQIARNGVGAEEHERQGSRESAAYCRRLPLPLLEELAQSNERSMRKAIASNPSCTARLLMRIDRHEREVMEAVVRNQNCPLKLLEEGAADERMEVRKAVCQNPWLPLRLMSALAGDADPDVRKTLAAHPLLPSELRRRLREDADADVRYSAHQTNGAADHFSGIQGRYYYSLRYSLWASGPHDEPGAGLPMEAAEEDLRLCLQERPARAAVLLEQLRAGFEVGSGLPKERLEAVLEEMTLVMPRRQMALGLE